MNEPRSRLLLLGLATAVAIGLVWWTVGGGEPPLPVPFAATDLEAIAPPDDPWIAPGEEGLAPRAAPAASIGDLWLRGRVLFPDGSPAAKARVRWAVVDGDGRGMRLRRPVETGADGRFAFAGRAPREARLVVVVRRRGFAPSLVERGLRTDREGVDLGDVVLRRGGVVSGRVVGSEREALAGATVGLRPVAGNDLDRVRSWRELLAPVTTGADGVFRVEGVVPGSYRLESWAPGRQRRRLSEPLHVSEGREVRVGDIVLARGYRLEGVVRKADGLPIAGAHLRVREASELVRGLRVRVLTRTADDGRFAVDHLPPRPLRVTVEADGWLSKTLGAVDPTVGEPLEVLLEAGLTLRGRVLDANGEPVTRFSFLVRRVDPDLEHADAAMPSAPHGMPAPREHPEGRFVREGLDAGAYAVDVFAPGHAFARRSPVALRPGRPAPEVLFRLARGLRLAGDVVDTVAGEAVPGARVELHLPAEAEPPTVAIGVPRATHGMPGVGPLVRATTADASGRFVFSDLAPCDWVLVARAAGFTPARSERGSLRSDREGVRLRLAAPASLSGLVDGVEPGAPARVIAFGGVGRLHVGRIGSDGRYRIDGLLPGPYLVRATRGDPRDVLIGEIRPRTTPAGEPVAPDVVLSAGERREFRLVATEPPVGAVAGRVREKGEPVAGCRVTLVPIERPGEVRFVGRHLGGVTDARGAFRVEDVPAGSYRPLLRPDGAVRPRPVPDRVLRVVGGSVVSLEVDW